MLKLILFSGLDDLKTIGDKIFPNWQDLVIQLLATLIVVLIVSKFLYKPAQKFIKKRKDFIANNLNEAQEKNQKAETNYLEAESFLKQARKTSKEIIDEAKITALNEKDKIIKETQEEIKNQRLKAKQDLELEKIKVKKELEDDVIETAILAASQVVSRNINKDDNQKIIQDFLKENHDE